MAAVGDSRILPACAVSRLEVKKIRRSGSGYTRIVKAGVAVFCVASLRFAAASAASAASAKRMGEIELQSPVQVPETSSSSHPKPL